MRAFLARRLVMALLSLLGATFLVFGISQLAQDPLLLYAKPSGYGVSPEQVAALRHKLGIDRPIPVQYVLWLGRIFKGDLGNSIQDELPVRFKLSQRIPTTLKLGVASWVLATMIGVPMGVLAAVQRGRGWDTVGRVFALFGQAVPGFWLGIMLVLVFSVHLNWLPSATAGNGFFSVKHYLMPVFVLGTATAASYLRITRSAMLDVLDSEYVKMARSKGVNGMTVIWKHAFRNALITPITVSAVLLGSFITGSVITETVFALPGLGSMAVQAVSTNDFPLLSAAALFFSLIWVSVDFFSDLVYVVIDPRIRLT